MNPLIHAMTRHLDVVPGEVLKKLERYTSLPTPPQPTQPKSARSNRSLKIKR
jgi:hypothetical protein